MANNRRRTLPQVSPKVAAELRPMVTAIKEIIETGEGVRGDPLDRKLTFRDLVDGGVIKIKTMPIGGGAGSIEPGDGTPDLTAPPAPTGFNAYGGFNGRIDLTWTVPGSLYSNHAHTNVYRAEEDNFANAILVGREAGSFYTDIVRDDAAPKPYYYWISFTSVADIEGPLNATAGTLAQALLDPAYIIEQIQGLVSESELAAEVLTPIQAIPGIETTLGDHNTRLNSAESQLADLLNVPAYDSAANYVIDDLVTYNGSTWRALVDMTAPAPTPAEGASWTKVGDYASFADQVTANTIAVDDLDFRVTNNEGTITSYGTDITALQTQVNDAETAISGNSTAIGTLDSRVTQAEDGLTANSSDITLLETSVNDLALPAFDANKAYQVGEFFTYSGVVYEVIATQATPNQTPPDALYYMDRPGYSSVSDVALAKSAALSMLDSRVVSAEGSITANSSDITQLQVDVNALDPADQATALQELDVRVTANEDDITAISSDITTLSTTVNNNTSSLQTKAEVTAVQNLEDDVTVLSAQYSVKLDVSGYVSGIGLANDGTASEFIVASDSVYFVDPGQSINPFDPGTNYSSIDAARNTQLVFGYASVEGQKRFVINVPAYIPEGYITSGQVGAIGFGKIVAEDGFTPVTTVSGQLKGDYIETDNLRVAVAATFDGDAQSGNFVLGSQGWRLLQSGRLDINEGYIASSVTIGGLGGLAYENSVFYNEINGTKPPPNADVTGSNTAYDTSRVAGTYASTVRNNAAAGANSASKIDNWTRPYSTLIDGNKIFTGDAYVDTLQIKGNAVTVPVTAVSGGKYGNGAFQYMTQVSISLDEPGDVAVWWNFTHGYRSGGAAWGLAINNYQGQMFQRINMEALNDYPSSFVLDRNVPAGYRTYILYWWGANSNVSATGRLFAMATMR